MIEIGQLRRWKKELSSLDGKAFLIIDYRIVKPEMLGIALKIPDLRLYSTIIEGRIDQRTDQEIEDFSEVIE